jgi:hypothetical protein
MRGVRGVRSVRFTGPDGNQFAELAAPGGDFTNPMVDGKIAA